MQKAIYVEREAGFGSTLTRLNEGQSAMEFAADSLNSLRMGVNKQKDYKVQECDVPELQKSGLRSFDKALANSHGFFTGNVFSNTQTSFYVRAHTETKCNGLHFDPGSLRATDLKRVTKEMAGSKAVQGWFKREVPGKPAMIFDPDETTILYRVFHESESGLIEHGWVLTGENGDLINRLDLNGGVASKKIMDEAVKAFTHQRSNPVDLITWKDGKEVFVHPEVLAIAGEYEAASEQEHQRDRQVA